MITGPSGCPARQFDGLHCKSWPCMNASRWSQPSRAAISCRAGLPARSWNEPTACHSLSRSLRGPSSIPVRSRWPLRTLCRAGSCRIWCRQVFKIKHAMIQEVAFSSLLKEERRELHARVASWLLQEAAIGESSQPAVLGYHYARAGDIPDAIDAWLQAGKSALRRSATKEAVAHLREGISLIPRLPASPQRFEAEIALQSNLAMAYTANAGWSDPHVYGPYSRALKLCESHGTIREKVTVLWGSTIAKLV